jgi:release factor glutamine methyltransferase
MALLEAASGQRREALIAHGSDPAPREVQALFERMVAQRRLGMPIAYLTGFREF